MEKLERCDWFNVWLELVRCKKLEEDDGLFGEFLLVDDKNIWIF